MTNFAKRGHDMAPGEGVAPRAPVRHVTRLAEEPGVRLAGIQGHPDDGGTFWALVARYVNGAEEFDFGVYALEPEEYHPRHFHPAGAEFYYILEGSGLVTIGAEDVEAAPGTAFYMPAGTVHAVRTRTGEKLTMVYGFSSGDFRDTGTTWLE